MPAQWKEEVKRFQAVPSGSKESEGSSEPEKFH